MNAYRRNIAVGLTVLVSLVGLAAMLIKFGGSSVRFFRPGHELDVHFVSARADGLSEGGQIKYQGVSVGRIVRLRRATDGSGVIIDGTIDTTPPLPGNVHGVIRQGLIGGSAEISLELLAGQAKPSGEITDGASVTTDFVGVDLIPPQFAELATKLAKATTDLDVYIADPKIKQDIQASLVNFRRISESVDRSADNVEQFSNQLGAIGSQARDVLDTGRVTIATARADVDKIVRQVDDRMLQLSKTLDTVQAVVAKINNGEGTAGMLVNDARLYQNLAEASRQLIGTVADIKRLVEQWEQEGISFKLK
jgi:phospholipid/cholesterol/gamma-HCH transport system substrate-binding protein